MPWFLRSKFLWLAVVLIASVIAQLYFVSVIIALILLYWRINYILVRDALKPLPDLSAERKIRRIENLIIGDRVSMRFLKKRFDISSSLIITAPGRSQKSSLLILQHVASRLDGKHVCIIIPSKNVEYISELDMPYLSRITKLELKVSENLRKRKFYYFYHPILLLRFILGFFVKPKQVDSEDEELIRFCERKGWSLTILNN